MLMIFWAIMSVVWGVYPATGPYYRPIFGGWAFLLFVLFFLLGWKAFGFVVQGT
jgi:hypothetical protein